MKALTLAIPLVLLNQGLWGQEDSLGYLSHNRTCLGGTIPWHDTMSSIRSENYRNRICPRFPTPLTLESWQEFKADTVARGYVKWVDQVFMYDSIKVGFHRTTWGFYADTVRGTWPPTFESWMDWLERKRASEH